ncbi:MAG: undecaprenyl-phosphate glucose phosphotransferase [Candidatus Electryoneaceae bacterium]|nr:undecaprenyl-phosphate glucose phosphotransferase [Candidatus Electryoneaceae bacterium]
MKRSSTIWMPAVTAMADGGAIILGAWAAYVIRFSVFFTDHIPIVTGLPPVGWYLWLSFIAAALTVTMLLKGGMYHFPRQDELLDELAATAKHYLLSFTLLLAALFFLREVSFSRMTMVLLFLFSGGSLGVIRVAGRWCRQQLYRRGIGVKRAAVVGDGKQAYRIIEQLSAKPEFGLLLMGSIGDDEAPSNGLKRLGMVDDVQQIIETHRLDTLIIAPTAGDSDILPRIIKACYGVNVDFLYLPDVQLTNDRPKKVVEVGGAPLWTLKEDPFSGWQGLIKRVFDIVVTCMVLLAVLPLMVIVTIAIKVGSCGNLIYRQRRVGLDGREFNCLKFRSMRIDAEKDDRPGWTTRDDPRVTRIGRFIRRWSIDELPQLWNILRGDMSLVGPRPERPEYVKEFAQRIDGYQERHRVRSGLTGWAQVNGLRGNTPIEDRTIYDRFYVENWSLVFDLKILIKTLWAIAKGDNAY